MEWIEVVTYLAFASVLLLIGYALGSRRARSIKRHLQREMNAQALELLDARTSVHFLENYVSQQGRKDKLLKMTLRKLQQANTRCQALSQLLENQKKQHFSEISRLRLQIVESHETAIKAADIARKATVHLQRLEKACPVTQTIEAPVPKSYGTCEPVTVSVVDQARPDTPSDAITRVSHRDSARLTQLLSSNEASVPGA